MTLHLRASYLFAMLLAAATSAQESLATRGRTRFVELGCVHCHQEATPGDLTRQTPHGPDLTTAGARLRPAWLERALQDPRAVHPQARMPQQFAADPEGRQAAADVAAWLATLAGPLVDDRDAEPADDEGETLFWVRGCVACHGHGDTLPVDSWRLPDLAAKTTRRQLARLLEEPQAVYRRGSMPDMDLTKKEAQAIARWLIPLDTLPAHAATTGVPERGLRIAQQLHCAACHALPSAAKPTRSAPPLPAIVGKNAGCLATVPTGQVPRFALTDTDRAAIAAFLRDPYRQETAADQTARRLTMLRCTACHERGGDGGMLAAVRTGYHARVQADALDHADPPSLSGLDQRLRPSWIQAVMQQRQRVRPWMKLRMPHYPVELTTGLDRLLAGEEPDQPAPPATLAQIEAGRELIGFGGLNCVVCHDFGGHPAGGSRAPDLTLAWQRLRPDYLRRWIFDPMAVHPGTRMPTYFRDGKSGAVHILDGEQEAQIAAITALLCQGERAPLPVGLGTAGEMLVTPTSQPLVWRTIWPGLSPRALGIGFPELLSVAFDLDGPRLGYCWQGGFVKMQRKWTSRGDGPCNLVGGKLLDGGRQPLFAGAGRDLEAAFAGYRLEGQVVVLAWTIDRDTIEIAVDVVRTQAAHGLRLRVHNRLPESLTLQLAPPAAGDTPTVAGLVPLAAADGARCYLLGAGDEALGTVALPARATATAILWFPLDTDPTTLQPCAAWPL